MVSAKALRSEFRGEAIDRSRNARDVGKRRYGDLAHALLSMVASRPDKEGHDTARRIRFIAIEQMVDIGVLEVDGLLDKAKAKKANVEIEIALCVGGDRAYVVDAN